MASTQEAFDHHVQGFVARDVSVVVKDFDEGSLVIAKGEIFRGLAAVRDYSTELFEELPKDAISRLPSALFSTRVSISCRTLRARPWSTTSQPTPVV